MTAPVRRILFVCTGNTCRSPLAEAMARQLIAQRGLPVVASSAGTSAWEDAPASDGALLIGLERALDLNTHRARVLTDAIVAEADLILTMGPHHLAQVEALGGGGRAHLLTEYASRGQEHQAVPDPFGGDLAVYRETADVLAREVARALDRAVAPEPPAVP